MYAIGTLICNILTYGAGVGRSVEVCEHVFDVERLLITGGLADIAHKRLLPDAGLVFFGHVFGQSGPDREHGLAARAGVLTRPGRGRRRRGRGCRRDSQQRSQICRGEVW